VTDTCAQGLKVLNGSNGQDLGPAPAKLVRDFHAAYRDDAAMRGVDAFVCSHPAAMCELFEPFGKPRIVYATTRFEMARCFSDAEPQGCARDPSRWVLWLERLREMTGSGRDLVLANSAYDANYMAFFLGRRVEALPSFCDQGLSWAPSRREVLLSMPQAIENALRPALEAAVRAAGLAHHLRFTHIRRLYPRYEYTDLAAHPAIVLIPYQVFPARPPRQRQPRVSCCRWNLASQGFRPDIVSRSSDLSMSSELMTRCADSAIVAGLGDVLFRAVSFECAYPRALTSPPYRMGDVPALRPSWPIVADATLAEARR
jgi:hypothetical protein